VLVYQVRYRYKGFPDLRRLVIDLDGTLTIEDPGVPYADKLPDPGVVEKVREYRRQGFEIVIATSRNMRTYASSVGKINAHTLPTIIDWLRKHDIPYDEIHVGKPWCGTDGFYVDDRSIRPEEFRTLGYDQIRRLLHMDGAPGDQ
jgi:capsule biosynthesis phosphatase